MIRFRPFFLLLYLFVSFFSSAQDQRIADSLKKEFNKIEKEDTSWFRIVDGISFNEANPDSAAYYAEILISAAGKDSITRWLHAGYFQKGNAERLRGDLDKALDCYFRSLRYAYDLEDEKRVGVVFSTIADTYSSTGNSSSALEYYDKAIDLLRGLNDSIQLASAILNAGDELFKIEEYDSALHYFEESGGIFDDIGYSVGQAYNLGNEGMVYAVLGQHDKAEAAMLEATDLLEEVGDFYPIAVYNFFLSDIYYEKGQLDLALQYAHAGHSIGLAVGLKEQIRDGARKLADFYSAQNDAKNAYRYLQQHLAYKDSVVSIEVVQQMADLRREFELREKQAEIDFANQEKENQQKLTIALAGILALTVVLIITLYRNNQQKKITNRKLQELNETKDKFFSIISHDLRGPVSSFYGITRIVKMYIKKKNFEALDKTFDEIDNSVKSLGDLLDNLLHWAIQQRGRMPYQPERLSAKSLFDYTREIFSSTAEAKEITIEYSSSEGHFLWADRNTTQTILRNLLSNAIKFTPEGGKVSLRSLNLEPFLGIQVQDYGVGIPSDTLKNLFGSVGQKSTFGTRGEKGTGLGLQLVHDFVVLNHGKIEVESEVGKGTTFTVLFPKPSNSTKIKEKSKEEIMELPAVTSLP